MILVVDNHDSFTFNLAQLFGALGADCVVKRAGVRSIPELLDLKPSAVVISPGPGHPNDAGYSLEMLRAVLGKLPVLGVCLGHQCLAAILGAIVEPAARPMHGLPSPITHCEQHLFRGIPSPVEVGRYHSLIVREDSLPTSTHVCAHTATREVMAFAMPAEHAYGVQFHPESFLTPSGHQIATNFLEIVEPDATVRRSTASALS